MATVSLSSNKSQVLVVSAAFAACSLLMFAFGYAMIPLYYKFCAFLGIETARDTVLAQANAITGPRSMRVEFDANSHNELVSMRPVQRIANTKVGTAYSITYEIKNLTSEPLRGTAVPSYSPARVAAWFNKLQCFCFNELSLAPHETLRAPVVFRLDHGVPTDFETISLSYTFYPDDQGNHAH